MAPVQRGWLFQTFDHPTPSEDVPRCRSATSRLPASVVPEEAVHQMETLLLKATDPKLPVRSDVGNHLAQLPIHTRVGNPLPGAMPHTNNSNQDSFLSFS